jgi:hypothetical protein
MSDVNEFVFVFNNKTYRASLSQKGLETLSALIRSEHQYAGMVAFIKQVRTQYSAWVKAGINIDLSRLEQDFLNAQQEFNSGQDRQLKAIWVLKNLMG